MKQALLVVSFGTSVPLAEESIAAVESALADAAPGYAVSRAYTSPTIRRILMKKGRAIDSLEQALARLCDEGFEQVAVQPTFLLGGMEYENMVETVRSFAPRFASLFIGRPLLADTQDVRRLAEELSSIYPKREGESLVLMGHGSLHAANLVYPALQTACRLLGREDIVIATVEGWPSLEDVLHILPKDGPRGVRLAPLMLVAGDHAMHDMAGEESDSLKSRLEQAGYKVNCSMTGLGMFIEIQKMYKEHLLTLLKERKV